MAPGDRQYSVFVGAAILASLTTFQQVGTREGGGFRPAVWGAKGGGGGGFQTNNLIGHTDTTEGCFDWDMHDWTVPAWPLRYRLDSVALWQMWISKDEYKDAGKVIVHRKCF